MKRPFFVSLLIAGVLAAATPMTSFAQEAAGEAAPAAAGEIVSAEGTANAAAAPAAPAGDSVFYQVLFGSGPLGFLLWMALFGAMGMYIYYTIICGVLVRPDKIMPNSLIANVQAAMEEGDVVKALDFCKNEPTPMANILTAGFTHVEEGFDVIQEAISAAADLEVERMMQQISWLSVAANIAPQLGLLGTVQGMIMAFANLGGGGTPDTGLLAVNISQALWTTAGGLVTSIPAVCTYYIYRNKANRIILRMEATTMELIKALRNVEVVAE